MKFKTVFISVLMCIFASVVLAGPGHTHAEKHEHEQHQHEQHGHKAHVHEEAEMMLAFEGDSVVVELISPADNIVGFEHQPKSSAEVAAIDEALKVLRQYANLFEIEKGACRQARVEINSPFKFDHHHDDSEHAHHDQAESQHSEFQVSYELQCEQIRGTRVLRVDMFKHFPRLHKVKVQWVGAGGQGAGEVKRDSARLKLKL